MSTLGTNYGVSELRIALALEDAINHYLVDGTMPNEGTLYGISEKRLAIAIAENTSISGGGSAAWGAITGNLASQSDLSIALGLKQNSLVSGTNIKTVNSTTLLGSGDIAVQSTLVSGTNIKTINSTSLLGSGDIAISTTPAGSTGQIQFNNSGNFGASNNFTWDSTGGILSISSTQVPSIEIHATDIDVSPLMYFYTFDGSQNFNSIFGVSGGGNQLITGTSVGDTIIKGNNNKKIFIGTSSSASLMLSGSNRLVGINNISPSSQLHISNALASQPVLKLVGATSQSANLFEILNSTNTVLSCAKADGSYQPANLTDASATNNSAYFSSTTSRFTYKNSAGVLNSFSGINTGDQTSIVGITGTTSQFNTALTDGDFATLAGTETLTNKVIVRKISTKTGNYTLTNADNFVRFNGTNLIATLPDATTLSGYEFEIKNVNTTNLTINTTSSQLMDSDLTTTLIQYEALKVISNGVSWDIV